jgi:ComF family protein
VRHPKALWQFTEAGPVRNILHQLKYANAPWLGGHIGDLVADLVPTDETWQEGCVIPVPLSPTKRIERGYNQSGWIAKGLASAVGCRLIHGALARRRPTRSQTTLGRGQRLSNVAGAFHAEPSRVLDEHIILVDDTITTGATILECARTLRSAGARMVLPLAAASAPLRAAMEPRLLIPVLAS